MDRNRQRLAEPHRSPEHERHVEHDERIRHVASCRPIHDEATKARHQKREERDIPPLPWRYPHPIGQQDHQDNSKIRRVEDVFTVHSQDELARDGDRGRRDRDRQRIGSQEQAKRQTGDQRAAWIERRQFPDARADVLNRQGGADHRARLRAADLEVEAEQAVYEQRREQRDLVVPGIRQQMSPLNRTMALRGRLVTARARVHLRTIQLDTADSIQGMWRPVEALGSSESRRSRVHGRWSSVPGPKSIVLRPRPEAAENQGHGTMDEGPRTRDEGRRTMRDRRVAVILTGPNIDPPGIDRGSESREGGPVWSLLFVPDGVHRIDRGRAVRRSKTGHHRDGQQQKSHATKDHRIA
jgi:hypothetical protein